MKRALIRSAGLVVVASIWVACAGAQSTPPAGEQASAKMAPESAAVPANLTELRAIARDTLKLAQAGDLLAARKRVDDLETSWNQSAPELKSLAPEKWKAVDAAIDRTERELRFWRARHTDSVEALQKLVKDSRRRELRFRPGKN